MLYFYKQHSLVQPEELHLNGDGVYFNIFTEDSRGEDTTGTLKNIGDDTVLYASIQNAGKNRYMQLTGYLDYQEIPLTFLSEEYNGEGGEWAVQVAAFGQCFSSADLFYFQE